LARSPRNFSRSVLLCGFTKLVDRYLSAWHPRHPESGRGVSGNAADVARSDGSARDAYTHQVHVCLAVLADLIDNPDRQVGERDAVLTLSVVVGAISMARAIDDPDLSQQILTYAAAALKERVPKQWPDFEVVCWDRQQVVGNGQAGRSRMLAWLAGDVMARLGDCRGTATPRRCWSSPPNG
jgi:hypothetical protein